MTIRSCQIRVGAEVSTDHLHSRSTFGDGISVEAVTKKKKLISSSDGGNAEVSSRNDSLARSSMRGSPTGVADIMTTLDSVTEIGLPPVGDRDGDENDAKSGQDGRRFAEEEEPEIVVDASSEIAPLPRPPSVTGMVIDNKGDGIEERSLDELSPDEVTEIKALLPTLRRLRGEDHGGGGGGGGDRGTPRSARWLGVIGDDHDDGCGSSSSSSDGDDEYIKLSRDTFSLLFAAGPRSLPFIFAMLVFAFQILILILVLVDVTDLRGDNALNIPAGVSTVVRIAQFTAVIVAVATQSDLITSLNTIYEGYPGVGWIENDSGGTMWQWAFAAACRFVEGGLCLVATWVLIVSSDAVVDLFLDFMAMIFVSEIDDIAFALARDYFSGHLKKETKLVSSVRIPSTRAKNYCFRQLLFGVVSLGMIAGWSVIVHKQNLGEYQSCNSIVIQMGDTFDPRLAYFSGMYELHAEDKIGGRVTYREKGDGRHHGRAMIAYCESEGSWTFSYSHAKGTTPDPCLWHAKVESDEFDVMEISPGDWYVLGLESKDEVPFFHFSYECEDCEGSSDRGLCSEAGNCVNNHCVCDEGRYGRQCEFLEPCPLVEVDTSEEGFGSRVPQKFGILLRKDGTKAFAYGRPVYFANATGDDWGAFVFIAFTGRRWMISSTSSLDNSTRSAIRTSADLAQYLSTDFHAYWSTFKSNYSSGPMDMSTPEDSLTPTELPWYRVTKFHNGADENRPIPTLLLCARCHDETNPCSHAGECRNGTCVCPYGAFGALCQVSDFKLCKSLSVQYGDEVRASLGSFAGVYDVGKDLIDGRSVYYERHLGRSMFAYCEDEEAWVFAAAWWPGRGRGGDNSTKYGMPGGASNGGGHCTDWVAMSSVTDSYDLTLATDWVVRRTEDADEGVPLLYMSLRCNDCNPNYKRSCGLHGTCYDNNCQCSPGRYGLNCELNDPCRQIELDSSKRGFSGFKSSHYSLLTFDNGTDVKVYHRPVYVSEGVAGGNDSSSFDMILFVGRRWIVTNSASHEPFGSSTHTVATRRHVLAEYLSTTFHGYYTNYTVNYMSEPADISTLIDTPSPVDLVWYKTKSFDNKQVDTSRKIEAMLISSFCDNVDYVCYNGGDCRIRKNDTYGVCSCPLGAYGTLCQVQPKCYRITAQFGLELGEALRSLSGAYALSSFSYGGRPAYALESNGGGANAATSAATFAFCSEERSWTFTAGAFRNASDGLAPCRDWAAKSSQTITYDVATLTSWVTTGDDGDLDLVPLTFFTLSCLQDEIFVRS